MGVNDGVSVVYHKHIDKNVKRFSLPYIEDTTLAKWQIKEMLINEMPFVISQQLPIEIIARALTDNDFKNELIKDPTKILTDFGYDLDGYKYEVYVDTKDIKHFIAPNSPINNSEVATITEYIKKFYKKVMYNSCNDPGSALSTPEDAYCKPYDTRTRIECTSLPTCQ